LKKREKPRGNAVCDSGVCRRGLTKDGKVVRHSITTGENARPMTQQELDAEHEKREKAVDMMAMEKAILFEEQKGEAKRVVMVDEEVEDDVKEVNKAHGIEAFAAGEYVQALLLHCLALDKADELPNKGIQKRYCV
jgi:hypothetical protein